MEENLVKISELNTVDELYEGCCFPLVQQGETKRIEYSVLKEMLNRDLEFVKSVTELDERIGELESNENKQNESIRDLKTGYKTKVDKVDGKNLSSNDFTNELKSKLENIDLSNYYTKTEIDNIVGNIESLLEVI